MIVVIRSSMKYSGIVKPFVLNSWMISVRSIKIVDRREADLLDLLDERFAPQRLARLLLLGAHQLAHLREGHDLVVHHRCDAIQDLLRLSVGEEDDQAGEHGSAAEYGDKWHGKTAIESRAGNVRGAGFEVKERNPGGLNAGQAPRRFASWRR